PNFKLRFNKLIYLLNFKSDACTHRHIQPKMNVILTQFGHKGNTLKAAIHAAILSVFFYFYKRKIYAHSTFFDNDGNHCNRAANFC
ncbi:TPA: hypothetical protein ACXVZD_001281, partial [Neisseria meningitidis]